jgi:DNA-binding NtrC family response regulator
MSLGMQSKLLRVLQERTLERVGGTKPVTVYCRLIAATNKDLTALRSRGDFREDLYYRLSTVTLKLPPLRARARDIPAFVRQFVKESNAAYGRSVKTIPEPLMRRLQAYPWPGNIRQLKNVITNAVILSDGEEISDLEFGDGHAVLGDIPLIGDLHTTVAKYANDAETSIIRAALEKNGRNITKTALALGVSRKTLYEKIRRHDL